MFGFYLVVAKLKVCVFEDTDQMQRPNYFNWRRAKNRNLFVEKDTTATSNATF